MAKQRDDIMKRRNEFTAKDFAICLAVTCVSMIVFPVIIDKVSSCVYKKVPRKHINVDDDNWGPEIVKKDSNGKDNK